MGKTGQVSSIMRYGHIEQHIKCPKGCDVGYFRMIICMNMMV